MNAESTCAVCQKTYRSEQDYLSETRRWRVCSLGHLWFNCRCGSTLMIKKGKFDWYDPGRAMSNEARSVFNRLGNLSSLPHIPNIVMQLQQMMQSDKVSPKELSAALRAEPVLATQTLQTAEGLQRLRNPANPPIRSLEHAIVYVGLRSLSDLLMKSSLKSFALPFGALDEQLFWSESVVAGSISEFLMRRFAPNLHADEAYLAGSLCNIGKLVAALTFAPISAKIVRDVANPQEPRTWRQAEQDYQFPDHCILGEIAAAMWGFPEYTLQAVRRHHDSPTGKKPFDLNDIVAVANQFTHWVLLNPHRIEQKTLDDFAKIAKLSSIDMDKLALELTGLKNAILAPSVATIG